MNIVKPLMKPQEKYEIENIKVSENENNINEN